jgi:PAS domain S-box-containing protein
MNKAMTVDDLGQDTILAAIIDSSEDAIISKNLDGIIITWNRAAERLFGYKAEEVIDKHISILIPKERLAEEQMIISSLRAGKRIEHYETIRLTKSGREVNISLTVSPVKNAKGVIIGASKIARDITKQKEAEATINKYTHQLEVINSIGKSIAAELNIEAILQKVTDATTGLSGAAFGVFFYKKVDAKGESYMLYTLSGISKAAFEKSGYLRDTAWFDIIFSGEGISRSDDLSKDPHYGKKAPQTGTPEGHLSVISFLAVPVVSGRGTVIGGLFFGHPKAGMFKDEHENLVAAIASQAGIALDNAKLYENIHELNAKKDEFISFASHELKTPLTTISGYLQLAQQSPELTNNFLPKISKQVSRLSAIISDLLDISKIQAGKLDLNFTKTSLAGLLKESIETVRQIAPDHEIESEIPVEDIIVTIDNQKMNQVLINVMTNAVKYSPPHSKVLVTAIRFGSQVRISIQDSGMGIPSKLLEKIFGRFYRVAKSSSGIEGLGLGLYICKEIIENHQGRIWAESEEGKGSVFHIDFPIEMPA